MKIKALIVDDSEMDQTLISALLKRLDLEEDYANNGKEAIEKLKTKKYDICFMDIQMPIMDGIEATRIIRKEVSKDLPIIAVTAISNFSAEKSLKAGMNDYIPKPVGLPMLKNAISKFCKGSS